MQELSSVLRFMESVPGRMQKMAADSEDLQRFYAALAEFHVPLPKVRANVVWRCQCWLIGYDRASVTLPSGCSQLRNHVVDGVLSRLCLVQDEFDLQWEVLSGPRRVNDRMQFAQGILAHERLRYDVAALWHSIY